MPSQQLSPISSRYPVRRSSGVIRWVLLLLPAMVAHAAAADVQPLEVARLAPRIERIRFQSTVLGEARHFIVVLPKSFDREKKDHASLVFLHGRGRNPQSLIEHPASRESLLNAEFVTLFPEGDIGWYIDSPANPKARYASYLEEVIELAVNRYGLSRQPAKRALAGWSMGGYGCVRFAQTHAGQFAAVSPILGLLDYPRSPESFPPDQRYPVRTEYFSTDPAVWKTLNPMTSADRMSGSSILLITADQAFDRTMNERFSRKLDELRIPHRLKMLQGTHSMTVVREAVPLVISHTQSVFRRQTPNRPAASSSTGDATPRPSERVDMPEPAPNASPTTNH